jgi:hypothetical protein
VDLLWYVVTGNFVVFYFSVQLCKYFGVFYYKLLQSAYVCFSTNMAFSSSQKDIFHANSSSI